MTFVKNICAIVTDSRFPACHVRAKITKETKEFEIVNYKGIPEHICPFDKQDVEVLRAKSWMKKEAQQRPDRLREIYDRAISNLSTEAKGRITYESMRQPLCFARRKRYPVNISSIDQMVALLTNEFYTEYEGYFRKRIDVVYKSKSFHIV